MTCDGCDGFTYQLLYSNWDVLVNEVLHCFDFIQLMVKVSIDLVKLCLYLHLLLLEVLPVLLGFLQILSQNVESFEHLDVLGSAFVKHCVNCVEGVHFVGEFLIGFFNFILPSDLLFEHLIQLGV